MDALFHHAAALRRVELVEPRSVIGKSTVESIQSGTLYGYAAQVDGMCSRIIDELGHATVVATGGLSEIIAPLSRTIDHREPWLTLHGLRLVYERNAKSSDARDGEGRRRRGRGRRGDRAEPIASLLVADVPYSFDRTAEAGTLHDRMPRSGPARRARTSSPWRDGSC